MMNQMQRQDKQVWTLQIKACSFLMGLAAKKTCALLGNPVDIDDEGLLADIEVQPIDDIVPMREDKQRDINKLSSSSSFLFQRLSMEKRKNTAVVNSACMCLTVSCRLAVYLCTFSCRDKKNIVNEATTLRRHIEAHHLVSLLLIQTNQTL
jgi:hypothetical protein